MCQFPQDHPIQNPAAGEVTLMNNNHVYIFTNTFDSCSGCVRSLTFCYRPNSATGGDLMTIEILRNSGGIDRMYPVTVNSAMDMTQCAQRYNLNQADCCVEHPLEMPFMVQSNRHYALNMGNAASLLLRHQEETVPGTQEPSHPSLQGSLYKPLFYFTIDTSSGMLYALLLAFDA